MELQKQMHGELRCIRTELAELRRNLKLGCCGVGWVIAVLAAQALLPQNGSPGFLQLLCALVIAFVAMRCSGQAEAPTRKIVAAAPPPTVGPAAAGSPFAREEPELQTELASTTTPDANSPRPS